MGGPATAAEAAALLASVRAGQPVADLGVPSGCPVLVVDLEGTTTEIDLTPPAGWPCVVVAISASSVLPPPPRGADVLLTSSVDPPGPWVSVTDLPLAVAGLSARVQEHAHAATVLVQVLRSGASLGPDPALVLESLAYATLQTGADHVRWLSSRRRPPTDGRTDPAVSVIRRGDTLAISLDRPERHNAYSSLMRDELFTALEVATADPSVIEVVVSGAGLNFCSGGDLAEFGLRADPATAHAVRMARSCGQLMARLAPKLRVHLHGACVGAGIELSAFAGRVTAAPDASCWLPEIAMGLIPGAGGTVSLPRRIGLTRAVWLALSGVRLDAPTALRWGLVDEILA